MFARRPKQEVQELADRLVEASIRLGTTVPDFAAAYVSLNPREVEFDAESRARAQDLVEQIAVDWRAAELTGATEAAVIEDLRSDDVMGLLAAIQDSLILALASDRQPPEEILSIEEAIERVQDLANENGLSKGGHSNVADDPDLVTRFDDLEMRLLEAVGEAAAVFPSVAPDESDLNEIQVAGCRQHLVALTGCGRELDRERDLVAALDERRDLRPSIGMLHSMVQALVLRLADDPERRAQATPLQDLATRYHPVLADWKTWI